MKNILPPAQAGFFVFMKEQSKHLQVDNRQSSSTEHYPNSQPVINIAGYEALSTRKRIHKRTGPARGPVPHPEEARVTLARMRLTNIHVALRELNIELGQGLITKDEYKQRQHVLKSERLNAEYEYANAKIAVKSITKY